MSLLVFLATTLLLLATVLKPRAYIYAVFLVGPMPFGAFLRNAFIATPLGAIHINALLVFSILLSSMLGLALNLSGLRRSLGACSAYVAFLVFAMMSIAWAPDFSMSFRMLMKFLTPVAFMLFVASTIERVGIKSVFSAVVASGALYGLASFASWALHISDDGFGLPATSRAVTSGQLLSTFGLLVADALAGGGLVRLIPMLLAGAAILAGFTRITIAGMFAEAAVAFFLRFKGPIRVLMPLLGLCAFVALFTFVDHFRSRMFLEKAESISFESVLEDPSGAISAVGGSGRYAAWDLALHELFHRSPVLGAGIGATQLLFYDPTGTGTSAVHSEVIRIVCDMGIVGLGLFVLAWFQIFRRLNVRRREFAAQAIPATFPIGAMTVATGYLVFFLTDNGLDYVAQMGVFVYGVIGAVIGMRAERHVYSTRRAGGRIDYYNLEPRPR